VIPWTIGWVDHEAKAQLSLDEQVRREELVSPEKPRFRFVYRPLP
jgi:hypothetical protein